MGLFDALIKSKKESHLEDAKEQNRLFPRIFLIPSLDD